MLPDDGRLEIIRPAGRRPTAQFRRDKNALAGRGVSQEPTNEHFAPPTAIDIGGVEEVDAPFDRGRENVEGLIVGDGRPPLVAELPGADADLGYRDSAVAEDSLMH